MTATSEPVAEAVEVGPQAECLFCHRRYAITETDARLAGLDFYEGAYVIAGQCCADRWMGL
jgi:hypothetical protein